MDVRILHILFGRMQTLFHQIVQVQTTMYVILLFKTKSLLHSACKQVN